MLLLGYLVRGQGVRHEGQFATIQKYATQVDGESFVVIRLADSSEKLVSVDELTLATTLITSDGPESDEEEELDEPNIEQETDEVWVEETEFANRDDELEPEAQEEEETEEEQYAEVEE